MTEAKPIPVCAACLGGVHFAGEPDFPHRPAEEGEDCGAADHQALTEDDGEPVLPLVEIPHTTIPAVGAMLTRGASVALLIDLGGGLHVLRLSYPMRGEDDVGDIEDERLVAWVKERCPRAPFSVDTLRWEAAERATTTGTIVDLAMCFYAED